MAYLDLNGLKYFLSKLKPKLVPPGAVQAFAGTAAPSGWLVCNGQAVSRSTYSALYSIIGTKYGSGDGRTTFNLPNLTGYTIIGGNSGDVGKKVGAANETLYANHMPPHWHPWAGWSGSPNNASGKYTALGGFKGDSWTTVKGGELSYEGGSGIGVTGGGQAHNNMQPSVYMTYIIKT